MIHPDFPDDDALGDELPPAKCRYCGAEDVYWQEIWDASGKSHWRLYSDTTNHPHVCDVTNDFEAL